MSTSGVENSANQQEREPNSSIIQTLLSSPAQRVSRCYQSKQVDLDWVSLIDQQKYCGAVPRLCAKKFRGYMDKNRVINSREVLRAAWILEQAYWEVADLSTTVELHCNKLTLLTYEPALGTGAPLQSSVRSASRIRCAALSNSAALAIAPPPKLKSAITLIGNK